MNLRYRLFVSFGIIVALIAIIGGIAVSYSNQVSQSLGVKSFVPKLLLISEIIVLIFGLFVGYFTSRSITKPLSSLTKGTEIIGKGNLKHKIEVKSEDEIGQLANAFNKMTADLILSRKELEHYSKNLEKEVAERTKELQSKMKEVERFNKLAVDRELKMLELKKRTKELEKKK